MKALIKMKRFLAVTLTVIGTLLLFFDDGDDDYILVPSSLQSRTLAVDTNEHNTNDVLNLAVCVQGAVRTFANTTVAESFERLRFPENTHFFHYMFVGKELSARGQEAVEPDQAPAMARALAQSTAFKFQYQENDFTCDNQANGKFHKIAECAKMVDAYSKENGVTFKALAFVRPDLAWLGDKFPPYHIITEKLDGDWYTKTTDEIFAISGSETGRKVAMNVEQAECCDTVLRQPKRCFFAKAQGFKESKTNFIQERYFNANLNVLHFGTLGALVTHFREDALGISYINRGGKITHPKRMHGKFRSDILHCKVPQTSPVVTGFQSLSFEQRSQIIENLLSAPHGEKCHDDWKHWQAHISRKAIRPYKSIDQYLMVESQESSE